MFRDGELVQAVLGGQHEAVLREMRLQRGKRGFRRAGLDRQHDAAVAAGQFGRRHRRHDLAEFLDRPGDREPCRPAGLDMLGHDVDEQDRNAGARPVGAERAADRAGAPDQDGFGGHARAPRAPTDPLPRASGGEGLGMAGSAARRDDAGQRSGFPALTQALPTASGGGRTTAASRTYHHACPAISTSPWVATWTSPSAVTQPRYMPSVL